MMLISLLGLSWWLSGKESAFSAGDTSLILVGKIPWRRKWKPTPIFLPGNSYGQRNLAGYSPCNRKRVRHDLATKQQKISLLNKSLFALMTIP